MKKLPHTGVFEKRYQIHSCEKDFVSVNSKNLGVLLDRAKTKTGTGLGIFWKNFDQTYLDTTEPPQQYIPGAVFLGITIATSITNSN